MTKFLESITNQFPDLQKSPLVDITDRDAFGTLLSHINAEYVNFDNVKRTDLYRLSMMIEDHAQRANVPLVATFETEHLYKYVEERYLKLLENIPKTWKMGVQHFTPAGLLCIKHIHNTILQKMQKIIKYPRKKSDKI